MIEDLIKEYGLSIIEVVGTAIIIGLLMNVCLPGIGNFIEILLERIM